MVEMESKHDILYEKRLKWKKGEADSGVQSWEGLRPWNAGSGAGEANLECRSGTQTEP